MDLKSKALTLYKAPFTYDNMGGYIWDAENEMVADTPEMTEVVRVRGWGRIQYMKDVNPEELQDQVGEMIAEALTDYWNKHRGE